MAGEASGATSQEARADVLRDRAHRGLRLGRVPVARGVAGRLDRIDPRLVLFESWGGRYSDSPRAISEELHRTGSALEQVWVVHAPAEAPPWATPVVPETRAHLRSLGRARYLVANNTRPAYQR